MQGCPVGETTAAGSLNASRELACAQKGAVLPEAQ